MARRRQRSRIGPRGPDNGARVRLDKARAQLDAGELDAATRSYVWLWDNLLRLDPSYLGVRSSFMASRMEQLVQRHPPARAPFQRLRDRAWAGAAATVDRLDDWIVLNEVLGEEERTLAWFDTVREDPAYTARLERLLFRFQELLAARDRWADIGSLLRDPIEEVRWLHAGMLSASRRVPDGAAANRTWLRSRVALVFRALSAARRHEEAASVRALALRLDGPDAMSAALDGLLDIGEDT